jgi:S1-C subfamily serine protease
MRTLKIVALSALLAGAGGVAYRQLDARAAESQPRTVSRDALVGALSAGPGQREARLVPELREGRPVGFRLFAVRKDGLLSRLGLQEGDVLEALADVPLTSPAAAMSAYGRVKETDRFTLRLVRAGQPRTIDVVLE